MTATGPTNRTRWSPHLLLLLAFGLYACALPTIPKISFGKDSIARKPPLPLIPEEMDASKNTMASRNRSRRPWAAKAAIGLTCGVIGSRAVVHFIFGEPYHSEVKAASTFFMGDDEGCIEEDLSLGELLPVPVETPTHPRQIPLSSTPGNI